MGPRGRGDKGSGWPLSMVSAQLTASLQGNSLPRGPSQPKRKRQSLGKRWALRGATAELLLCAKVVTEDCWFSPESQPLRNGRSKREIGIPGGNKQLRNPGRPAAVCGEDRGCPAGLSGSSRGRLGQRTSLYLLLWPLPGITSG